MTRREIARPRPIAKQRNLPLRLRRAVSTIAGNPARLVKRRTENNAKVRYLLPEEEGRLRALILKHCPPHLPELEVSLHTGMRRAEQYHLQWNWIDFHTRVLTVPRSKPGELRKRTVVAV